MEDITPGLFEELEDIFGWRAKIRINLGGNKRSRDGAENGHSDSHEGADSYEEHDPQDEPSYEGR